MNREFILHYFQVNNLIWIYGAYLALMGAIETVARVKTRNGIHDILRRIQASHPGEAKLINDAMITLLPSRALILPFVGSGLILIANQAISHSGSALRWDSFASLGAEALMILTLVIVVIINDILCIVTSPWPRKTEERLRKRLEREDGQKILHKLIPGQKERGQRHLQRELVEEHIPNLIRPWISRFFSQQAIRYGLSVALWLSAHTQA